MSMRSAFTIVEMVVVVLILGILAAVAGQAVRQQMLSANEGALRRSLTVLRDGIETWYAENGRIPSSDPDYADLISRLRGSKLPTVSVGGGDPSMVAGVTNGTPLSGTGLADVNGQAMWKYDSTTGEMIINFHAPSSTGEYYDRW
jgi:prepilin-type N-terminal cleavage/methylation domain-containing protein